ncbi:MAG: VCBS repeat-containing protein, partial [Akkermansiaceae bacterium]|nr:VCBS repeat-containing protein [Verrucomicrobiales bacterium]
MRNQRLNFWYCLTALLATVGERAAAADFALAFDGVNDYVRVASAPELTLSNRFTIEFWFKPATTNQSNAYLLSHNGINAGAQASVIYEFTANAVEFYALGFSGADPRAGSAMVINDPQWHHVAYTYNGTNWNGYLDGTNMFAVNRTFSLNTSSNDWFLGGASPGLNHVAGTFDEVRIWNLFRTKDDLQASLNRRLSPGEPGLMAYYKLDEGSGTNTTDNSAHGFSGTLVNGPQWVASDAPIVPDVITLPATNVSLEFATLRGTVNPLGRLASAWFEWGLSTNFGQTLAVTNVGSGSSNVAVATTEDFFAGGQTYYYRVVATNVYGRANGAAQSFTPPALFTEIGAGLTPTHQGSSKWGDYDNDGRLDILLTGYTGSGQTAQLWRNTPSGFVNLNVGLAGIFRSSVAWGDYDNDGRLDMLLLGFGPGDSISQLWRNTPGGFVNINSGLPGLDQSAAAWGDYDNDGRLDILITGFNSSGHFTQVWRNTTGGFVNINAGLPPVYAGSAAWGDYDNDGRLDILLTGRSGGTFISQVWRNTPDGFDNIDAGLPGVWFSSVAWGDYDNDGRLDILLAGDRLSGFITQVWRNTPGGFVNINAGLPGVAESSVAWGDYDNDGRLDVLLSGTNVSGNVSQVWRNTPGGFVKIKAGLPGLTQSSVAWGDYDNDGRLDILLTGLNGSTPVSQVWRNNYSTTNTPPLPPSGLMVSSAGPSLLLQWNGGGDGQTPAAGLTYNLRAGTTPGGSDILSPMAASTGLRRLPQTGNAQHRTHAILVPPVGNLYWSVQAIDTAFAGSAFSPEQTVTIGGVLTPTNGVAVPGDINGDGKVDDAELSQVLANYWPYSPLLQMTNVAGLGGSNVTFTTTHSLAGDFSVEVTTNLVNWQWLGLTT